MPSAAARRFYENQIPSFMSVFGDDSAAMDDRGIVTALDSKLLEHEVSKLHAEAPPTLRPAATLIPDIVHHKHNGSTSTRTTESEDSSPTTTVSCTDSSALTDPSPPSLPDSQINLAQLSFAGPSFGGVGGMAGLSINEPNLERPMTSPAPRRPKNMKGLSIQPPFNSISTKLASEPCSPSFIKPVIPAMKRKSSLLSLKTNSSDLMSPPTSEAPSSPSLPPILQRRALKHSSSSPHMLTGLKSAAFGPAGKLMIPTVLERNESGLSSVLRPVRKPSISGGLDAAILEEDSPIKTQIANCAAFELEPFGDNENNEDQKTPGYPDGPIAIYGDNVYLYLEPSAEEASKFDTVINVAREVKNPFDDAGVGRRTFGPENRPANFSPTLDTATTTASFATAFEFLPEDGSAEPPTPSKPARRQPDYIHMPWDHNTDIGRDLMMLCEQIEKKTMEGKKVLVHCQQGASRSASLIIAYGMYQNPELSVNDAYYAAQAKSKWISPNMRLMYCLQDFQKEVARKKQSPASGLRPRSGRSPTKHRLTLSVNHIVSVPKEPHSAPLPGARDGNKAASPARNPCRARGNSTPQIQESINPGPSSAPSSFSWRSVDDQPKPATFPRFYKFLRPDPPHSRSLFAKAPLSPGMAHTSIRKPPSPGVAPESILKSPLPLSRFAHPPLSPGFAPVGFRSHSFGSHRFGLGSDRVGSDTLKPFARFARGAAQPKFVSVAVPERRVAVMRSFPADDMALMSPRAETMTSNPLRHPLEKRSFAGMQFVEVPPTPNDSVFSPRETILSRDPFYPFVRPSQVTDPRSPPTKGGTPIVRSIDELI